MMDLARFVGEVADSGLITRKTVRMTYSAIPFRPLRGLHTRLAPCTVCGSPWHLGQGISKHRVGIRAVLRGGQCEQATEVRQSGSPCRCSEWHRDVRVCSDRCARNLCLPWHELHHRPGRPWRHYPGPGSNRDPVEFAAVHRWRRDGSGADRRRGSGGRCGVRASVTPSGCCLIEQIRTKARGGRLCRPLLRVRTPAGEVER